MDIFEEFFVVLHYFAHEFKESVTNFDFVNTIVVIIGVSAHLKSVVDIFKLRAWPLCNA